MRDLMRLQKSLQSFIQEKTLLVAAEIQPTKQDSIEARLGIYHDAYYLRLQEALEQDYPALCAYLGADQFNQLTREYIYTYPSTFRSIRWYGKNLANFIRELPIFSTQIYLSEMAEFEWLLTESFDGKDSHLININEIAIIPPEKWCDMTFHIQPALKNIYLNWNIVPMWRAYKQKNKCLTPKKNKFPVQHIIWRKNYEVQFCSLSNDENFMLERMLAGDNFGSICEGLCQWINEEAVAVHASSMLKRYMHDGIIIGIKLS